MSSSENGAAAIASLPEAVIFEIFTRLPAKSLMRFRCISKYFNSLVVDSHFVEVHRRHSFSRLDRTKILLCFQSETEEKCFYYTIDQIPENGEELRTSRIRYLENGYLRDAKIDSAANGLILMSHGEENIIICNVNTGAHIVFPLFVCRTWLGARLGFDSVSETYKMLRTECDFIDEIMYHTVKVFQFGKDTRWRDIDWPLPFNPSLRLGGNVSFGGFIYAFHDHNLVRRWYEMETYPEDQNDQDRFIGAFNVSAEVFSIIPFPPEAPHLSPSESLLVEVNGHLGIIHIQNEEGYKEEEGSLRKSVEVWIFEKSLGMEWEKQNTLTVMLKECEFICKGCCCFLNGKMMLLTRDVFDSFSILLNDFGSSHDWRKYQLCGELPSAFEYCERMKMVPIVEDLRTLSGFAEHHEYECGEEDGDGNDQSIIGKKWLRGCQEERRGPKPQQCRTKSLSRTIQ